MAQAAAIVLAGGRSSRMGSPKAELEWHGSTLLRRVTGLVARADGSFLLKRSLHGGVQDAARLGTELGASLRADSPRDIFA